MKKVNLDSDNEKDAKKELEILIKGDEESCGYNEDEELSSAILIPMSAVITMDLNKIYSEVIDERVRYEQS